MKNSKEIFLDLQQRITLKEDRDEIQSILYLVLEHVTGLSRADVFAEKTILLTDSIQNTLEKIVMRINTGEPIQYILGSTYFYGRKFTVSPDVLIPRPETELLVEEIIKEIDPFSALTILDIGTGSGCIAITLAKELPGKNVFALDVSEGALKIAGSNARELEADISFIKADILTEEIPVKPIDVIVSNPPYIAVAEQTAMKNNVLDFEPHLALFVPDDDPLLFYKVIAEKGFPVLSDSGKLFVEINEVFGTEVCQVFESSGFKNIRLIKDLQGKNRIVIAEK